MTRSRHRAGRPYQRARAQMFAVYGRVCHICGHGGAGEADHLLPVSVDRDQPIDWRTLRPAHGANCPCPICGRKCNTERGARPVDKMFRPVLDW